MDTVSFFLGANSYCGFFSLYDDFVFRSSIKRLYVIKGGPGGGKSGFMRRISEAARSHGTEIHHILCSADPASLDGIYLPQLNTMFVDGTAPHVIEPRFVGEVGFYIDLSQFCRIGADGLQPLTAEYKGHYARAYSWLSAAGSVAENLVIPESAVSAIQQRADKIAERWLKRKGSGSGTITRIFTDAFTGDGILSLTASRSEVCRKLVSLDNTWGGAKYFLPTILDAAVKAGYDVILCPCPLCPQQPMHLMIPELSLGFVSGSGGRRLHLDKTVSEASSPSELDLLKTVTGERERLLRHARSELYAAKEAHDRLEAAVNPYINFEGVFSLADEYSFRLALK